MKSPLQWIFGEGGLKPNWTSSTRNCQSGTRSKPRHQPNESIKMCVQQVKTYRLSLYKMACCSVFVFVFFLQWPTPKVWEREKRRESAFSFKRDHNKAGYSSCSKYKRALVLDLNGYSICSKYRRASILDLNGNRSSKDRRAHILGLNGYSSKDRRAPVLDLNGYSSCSKDRRAPVLDRNHRPVGLANK